MLLEIDGANSNPTQVLINAIQQRGGTGLTKEEEFYLGFLDNGVRFPQNGKKNCKCVCLLSAGCKKGH